MQVKSASFSTDNGQKLRFSCSYRISNNKNFIPKYLDNALKVLFKLHEHQGDRIGVACVADALNLLPKNISQVAQIFTKESKRNEVHIATT